MEFAGRMRDPYVFGKGDCFTKYLITRFRRWHIICMKKFNLVVVILTHVNRLQYNSVTIICCTRERSKIMVLTSYSCYQLK
jgi:hypothetical protein